MALAFSGGTDSAYLLYEAIKNGADIRAYYVKSAFQPQFELDDAKRMASLLHAELTVIKADILAEEKVAENPTNRCYYCKKHIFSAIAKRADADGYSLLIDGTNASDDPDSRPGMRAVKELSVRSPLMECGITKSQVRRASKDAQLFTWDKPAYSCLATRIPAGEAITKEKLFNVELAENYLFSLGFSNFRVRTSQNSAKIQIPESQFELLMAKRNAVTTELKKHFSSILLDLEARDE